jgi:hypothetical protein
MKYLYLLSFLPLTTYAGFSKPQLLARFMFTNAWNVPDNIWCFGGEPVGFKGKVYLNCLDADSSLMVSWGREGNRIIARTENEQLFSKPMRSFNSVSWYEFTETSAVRAYSAMPEIKKTEIKNLGSYSEFIDSFYPLGKESFFFKTRGESAQLWMWKNDEVTTFFNPKAAYLFSPQPGANGEIAIKVRESNLDEEAPDKIWLYNMSWKLALEDKASRSDSPWLSFRNSVGVESDKVLTIAKDARGEALITAENGKIQIIAREGVDLKRFDYFAAKIQNGIIVVRGEDFDGRKAVYVKDQGPFRKLITQGDVVKTDLGVGRVHYENRDAIFYGAPGLDEDGNVYLQATLTDIDYPKTLLGVGLIKFSKE